MPLAIVQQSTITPDSDFVETRDCIYKGEHFSVRDNGAIMRHPQDGRKPRKLDNVWTFGQKDPYTGYMLFSSARVHIIVATAFHGANDSTKLVVDHIDTNRCNNRPSNLRWLTRLENALNNPATRKKIIFLCGSIDAFINNPSILRDTTGSKDVEWMRTVTAEEAQAAYKRVMSWASQPSSSTPSGGKIGEWIYTPPSNPCENKFQTSNNFDMEEEQEQYGKTSNPLAVQIGWSAASQPEFPCCPISVSSTPLQDYFTALKRDEVFVSANYGISLVYEFTIYKDTLLVVSKIINGAKNFALTKITWNGQVFVHQSYGTFFEENGALASYTIAQDKQWTGPTSIDDFC